jgi:hypothetical protein
VEEAKLRAGAKATVKVSKDDLPYSNMQMGFTRGYLSSQTYASIAKAASNSKNKQPEILNPVL